MLTWLKRIGGIKATDRNEPVEVPLRVIIAAVALGMLVGAGLAPDKSGSVNGNARQADAVIADAAATDIDLES
ncbi:MAG: hypothetical protein JSV91_02750 [Phycisphaerales bacterium]|nr:MAG: hypothetical protein JSV91_02750 [Phycisphaerales bacterium]